MSCAANSAALQAGPASRTDLDCDKLRWLVQVHTPVAVKHRHSALGRKDLRGGQVRLVFCPSFEIHGFKSVALCRLYGPAPLCKAGLTRVRVFAGT